MYNILDNKNQVFVKYYSRKLRDYTFKKINANDVCKNHEIILCTYCNKPAYRLDNFWPYHVEYTACKQCYKTIKMYENITDEN